MSSHTLEGKKKTQNGVKRLMFTVLSILLEVVFLIGIFKGLNEYAVFIDNLTRIFAVILVLKIYGRNETSSMKTPWIILILTFPILGVALYFMIGMNGGTWKMRMRYKRIDEKLLPLLPENKEVLERLNVSDPKAGNVSNYIERNACYPVYQNTDAVYYDEAAKGLEAQLEDLAKAEVIIPDVASMERIGGVLQPIYDLVINQRIENRKLSMLRDSLLPKLMSGELDVSAVEL